MTLKELKQQLKNIHSLSFILPDGNGVPKHFHITEVGLITRSFIDCGGTHRNEKYINFQLWLDADTEHRLSPLKLSGIISKAHSYIADEELEVEVEYQQQSITRYGLTFEDGAFHLLPLYTDCLAREQCGIPAPAELSQKNECKPGGNCC
jgi:hypothetical protein